MIILATGTGCRALESQGALVSGDNQARGAKQMKVGVLTGGGDCPGLNAVIRAVVRKGIFHYQDEFVGFRHGRPRSF